MNIIPKPQKYELKQGFYSIPEGSLKAAVSLRKKAGAYGAEAYRLEISKQDIILEAGTEKGAFYGMKTLQQMSASYGRKLPCCVIEDWPSYTYRGVMIDCSRHFFTVADLKKMLEAASVFKFNVFHWHLVDDQGWRIEIDRYPELVNKGSVREYSDFGGNMEQGPYQGYYTKDDIRDIVNFCAERHIDVIPEIEMPGHVSAMLAAYPELTCSGEPVKVKTRGGIYKDILCAGKEEVYTFFKNVLDEVMELFPYDKIHIGGDEAFKTNWRQCPHCREKIKEQNLASEKELQGYMTNRIAAYLKEHGRSAIVWNDSLKGGRLSEGIIVQHWMNAQELTAEYVNNGGKMIASDFYHCYLDYPYGQTPLKKVYNYDMAVPGLTPEGKKNVLGVEAPVWTEYIRDLERMSYLCWPRLAAVAENGWSNPSVKDVKDLAARFKKVTPVLTGMGLKIAPERDWNPLPLRKAADFLGFWKQNFTIEGYKALREFQKENK